MLRGALTIAATLTGLVTLACSSIGGDRGPSESKGDDGYTRTVSVGSIDLEATWLGSNDEPREGLDAYPLDRFLLLEVGLDTHSGDLGSIDMVEAASLTADGDSLEPEEWIASSDDSHHRSGVLVFPWRGLSPPARLTVALDDAVAELVWEELPESE